MKKNIILLSSLVLAFSLVLFSCGSSQPTQNQSGDSTGTTESSQPAQSAGAIEGWPFDNALVQSIPECTTGSIMSTTEETHSIFIMVDNVSRDDALAYWNNAQAAGYDDITSQSDTAATGGFTYVASSDNNISLSVTWSPSANEGCLSLLAIQL